MGRMLYFESITPSKKVARPARSHFLLRGCTIVGEWLSLVEHLVRDQGVGGSNPLSPTNLSIPSFAICL
jgi:hypothetical protein